jgi:Rod binding domain-containing protein
MAAANAIPGALFPGPSAAALSALTTASKATHARADKARTAAQDFEAVFLNTMFQQMFTGIDGEGPFGGKGSAGLWRSFLTDEYARAFAKSGGIGIADHVQRALLAHQEARP